MTSGDLTVKILQEIAAVHETDLSDLDFVVGEYVDLEAVEKLVSQSDGFDELRFRVSGHEVVITGPDSVSVEPLQSSSTKHTN